MPGTESTSTSGWLACSQTWKPDGSLRYPNLPPKKAPKVTYHDDDE
jgi:hypothetical protein